jgi:hypothetical protein
VVDQIIDREIADREVVRCLEQVVVDRLAISPVVVLHGPRTVGKSRLGSAFIGGVVLHTGELAYQLADRLFAVPIDQLWTPPEAAR